MWIMTNQGVYMPATIPMTVRRELDLPFDWDMQIRARERRALVKVRKQMIAMSFEVSVIVDTRHMDYEYRFYCSAADYGQLIAAQVRAIDYDKFKPTTDRKGGGGTDLHTLYNRLWGVIARHYDSPILSTYERPAPRKNWWDDK